MHHPRPPLRAPGGAHALMQDAAFAAALRLCGGDVITLPCGHVVLRRRVFGLQVLMVPRAVPPTDMMCRLRAVGLGRGPLLLSPEVPCALPFALRLCAPRRRLVLPLDAPAAVRRARLHQNWRHQLKRAENSGLEVDHAALAPDDALLARAEAQARARGYRDWPAALTAAFADIAPEQTRLFTARIGRRPIAWMLFLRHGTRATYHIGLSEAESRALNAHNLLLWEAANWLAARGVENLDLGLALPGTTGLNRFKRRAGAVELFTGGTWLRWSPLPHLRGGAEF